MDQKQHCKAKQELFETRPNSALLGEACRAGPHEYGEQAAQRIDTEVKRLLQDAELRVNVTLTQQRKLQELVATQLLQHETTDREMLKQLMANRQPATATTGAAA